ncbi:MerR family transcriptional regulator [Beduini massiliensis]|uniref:MerR family transcriptional regulator n=1 Tax=Beduini massiliensis TaxID=1585974 RepID=UPI00059A994E|nr:MerR family transcriptional regulator [Beduini massiliensis]
MCTMKEVCEEVGMTYETLKFYCKEGLVPNVKRDQHNYRDFDERNIAWLKSLQCLRHCGLSIKDMKIYMEYCLQGSSSIPQRKEMLAKTNEILLEKMQLLQQSMAFIKEKQAYFDGVLAGEIKYTSNLIDIED